MKDFTQPGTAAKPPRLTPAEYATSKVIHSILKLIAR